MQRWEHDGPTILVADDLEDFREILATWLEAEGYAVLRARDGEEALDLARGHPVDLVLLDVRMPRRDGFSACHALKSTPKTRLLPVVLVTGMDDKPSRIQGIESGADDFLRKPVEREELLARVRSLLRIKHLTDQLEDAESVLFTLALGIDANDTYTAGHSKRVSQGSVALARLLVGDIAQAAVELGSRLGLSENELSLLHRAGLVHDLGKIGIPTEVLRKPGRFTAEERRLMEQHPVVGERICRPLKSLAPALPIIRHHHERLDGSGYPDGLKGDQIPLLVRIVSVADVYDALTSSRPYRKPLSSDEALSVLRAEARKGWWDSALIEEYERSLHSAPARFEPGWSPPPAEELQARPHTRKQSGGV